MCVCVYLYIDLFIIHTFILYKNTLLKFKKNYLIKLQK